MQKTIDSREKIIKVACDLFHAQGVHATGLEEILQKSGTGKGQFYHFFTSKDDLVHEALQSIFARLKSGQLPVKLELRSLNDLKCWFQFFIDIQKASGCTRSCPIATIGAEIEDSQERLRKDACEIFDWVRSSLSNCFKEMRRRGELHRKCDPQALADFCLTIMQGGLLLSKIQRNTAPFENAVQHALSYVKSLKA
jgi:AcrR family transcriptional regulator